MAEIYHTGTEFAANQITFTRGTVDDVVSVGVFHTTDAGEVPDVVDFTTVTLVQPGDPLAEGAKVDVLSLIGPDGGDVTLPAGTYQRWLLIETTTEKIIRRPDTLVIL